MFLLPRHIPAEIASALEEQFLCSSISDAMRNTALWLLEQFQAADVIVHFERGFRGGLRSDALSRCVTSRDGVALDYAAERLQEWMRADHMAVFDAACAAETHFAPRDGLFVLPIASDLIVVQGSERPFCGYFALLTARSPFASSSTEHIIEELPLVLSSLIACFIRHATSREEMLGFYAQDVKNHLLLTAALLNHIDTDVTETRERLLAKIRRAMTRITLETDLVLLADKDASEGFMLNTQLLQLNDLVLEAVSQLESLFETARMSIKTELATDLPMLQLDPLLFPSVIYNLLDNAHRFSRRGQKVLIRTKAQYQKVILEVSDSGIGIPEDQRKAVFLKHFRASNNTDGEGNGLGLYLVKKIVEAHRGDVVVTKRPNARTSLVVELPYS